VSPGRPAVARWCFVVLTGASALALAGACGPSADPGAMAAVQIGGTGTPPAGCRMLAQLEGKDDDRWAVGGLHYEKAILALRRQAVLGGGNYLFIDKVAPPRDTDYMPAFIVQARLFACPAVLPAATVLAAASSSAPAAQPPATTGAPAPPATALVCEPDCSPGYTCLRGKCVSACNPLCAANERCGADRICHPLATTPPLAP
jgi:hypothetical protein